MKEAYRNDIVRTRLLCRGRPNREWIEISRCASIGSPAETASVVNVFWGSSLGKEIMRPAVDGRFYRNPA